MSRRSLLLAAGILVLLGGGASTILCLLVRYEPKLYLEAAVPPGQERTDMSKAFTQEFTKLVVAFIDDQDRDLDVTFTEKQINSYFAESFITSRLDEPLEREGISQPRVVIEPNKVRVAFRYGTGFWSSIISIDLEVWVPENAGNVVALKLVGFRAGALPLSAQSLFERLTDLGRKNDIEVTWYRHEGKPVALLKFQPGKQPTVELQAIHLDKGTITIQGRCNDGTPLRAFLQLPTPAAAFKPQAE
jgi:hypothetical protein